VVPFFSVFFMHIKMMVSRICYAISESGNLMVIWFLTLFVFSFLFSLFYPLKNSFGNTIDASHHRTNGVGF